MPTTAYNPAKELAGFRADAETASYALKDALAYGGCDDEAVREALSYLD